MRLFGIKCEVCCHKHMQSGDPWHHETKIPHGWLLVYNGDKGTPQDTEPYHFCSFDCLHIWTKRSINTMSNEGKSLDPDVMPASEIKTKTALL